VAAPDEIQVRTIRPDEWAELRAIRIEAISDTPTAFGSTLDDTRAHPDAYWRWRAENNAAGTESVLFVAERSRGWVGLAGAFLDESNPAKSCDLISMWVRPTERGRGIGRGLVEAVVAWARSRGLEQVALWVTATNLEAAGLYRNCGFVPTGETQPLPSHSELVEERMVLRF
jgi:GNAT superfamily N-acetyltransferase